MSQENVELVQRCFRLFSRGDYDGVLECFDPEVEVIEPGGIPGARRYRGYAGVAEAYSRWAAQWDDFSAEIERLVDAGERVVVLARHRGRGRSSGIPVEMTVAYLYTVRASKFVRWEMFSTEVEALEAAGLRE
jgi:uncharacterized protein